MRKWCWSIPLAVSIAVGCSPDARDQVKRFFFEIPEENVAGAVQPDASAPAPLPGEVTSSGLATASTTSAFVSVHAPYASRDCTACHQTDAKMSLAKDLVKSCGECHEKFFDEDEVNHDPVAEGDCRMCHLAHRSTQKWLLNRPVLAICSDCHEPDDLSEDAHGGPNGRDCAACHDAHFGKEHLLKADRPGAATGG